jgi:4,5:9,10-diseco-3-hydroxy-5,9,17-trioxoandrosta-1(10),2-diene-4-oate hydrolase
LPGFLEAALAALRAQIDLGGQREVLLDRLSHLEMPTLVVWGTFDRIFPKSQAQEAVARLKQGSLELIPDCGHLPHVERPDIFVSALNRFLSR